MHTQKLNIFLSDTHNYYKFKFEFQRTADLSLASIIYVLENNTF